MYLAHSLSKRGLRSVFVGGDCMEDVTSHLMPHLSLHPTLRTCSSDTILRGISELATSNTSYTSDTGKSYDFNTAPKLNRLLVKTLINTGQLVAGESYDLDFDHQFIETEKYDAKMTYKKFTGYQELVLPYWYQQSSDLCLAVSESAVPASLLVWYISCLYTKNVPLGTLFLWEAGGICRCKDRHFSFN